MYHLRLAAIDAGIVRSFTSGLPQFERVRARLLGSRCSSSVETNRKRIYSSVMVAGMLSHTKKPKKKITKLTRASRVFILFPPLVNTRRDVSGDSNKIKTDGSARA